MFNTARKKHLRKQVLFSMKFALWASKILLIRVKLLRSEVFAEANVFNCRGEHRSSVWVQIYFCLTATDFALQNPRTTHGRPYISPSASFYHLQQGIAI